MPIRDSIQNPNMEARKKNQLSILDRPLNPKGRGDVRFLDSFFCFFGAPF
jgi:hypothetical protein